MAKASKHRRPANYQHYCIISISRIIALSVLLYYVLAEHILISITSIIVISIINIIIIIISIMSMIEREREREILIKHHIST